MSLVFLENFFCKNSVLLFLSTGATQYFLISQNSKWFSMLEVESSRTSLASRTHFEVLGLETSSPCRWPRSLRSLKIALFSARGHHYFLNRWNFVGKRQKPRGKFANTFFCFPQLEHRISQASLLPPIKISPMTKMWQKSTGGPGTPSNQLLPANLNVNLEEMDSFRPKSCYLRITSSFFMIVMH